MTIDECPIDIVVPFVDCSDPVWQNDLKMRGGFVDNSFFRGTIRYRDTGTFKMMLDSVKKYMPWYNKIYIIVSHPSQVPDYAKDCEIIYHSDFIPKEFNPPVFSSSAIETWLGNLNVGEYFVYFNDDLILTRPWKKSDCLVVTKAGEIAPRNLINIQTHCYESTNNGMCIKMNTFSLITGIKDTHQGVCPEHGPHVFKLSWCRECMDRYYNTFFESCEPLTRTQKDYNQYVYMFYQYIYHKNDQYPRPGVSMFAGTYINTPVKTFEKMLEEKKPMWVCLNDTIYKDIKPYMKIVQDKYLS